MATARTTNAAAHDTISRCLAGFVQNQKTFVAWLFVMLVLSICRVMYLLLLQSHWPVMYQASDLFKVMARGTRFDCLAATYICTIPLVLGSLALFSVRFAWWAAGARHVLICVFLALAPVVLLGSVGYYREYKSSFNTFMFELFYDDTSTTLITMQREHALTEKLVVSAVLSVCAWLVYRRFFQRTLLTDETSLALISSRSSRCVVSLGISVLFVLGLRSSLRSEPLQIDDAAVTTDRFFNTAVLNGFYAAIEATQEHWEELGCDAGQKPADDTAIAEAACTLFPPPVADDGPGEAASARPADDPLYQITAGPKSIPPEHIFVIVMESYDAWPLMDKYRSLGLVENGRRFAEEGLHVKAFLPASGGSLDSYLALITGLHHTSRFRQRDFATSLPHAFNRLGFKTRLIIGDSATWQHMDDVARLEEFTEFYGAGAIVTEGQSGKIRAHDRELFAFVKRQLRHGQPSINVIRTISNHGPYEVDLQRESCALPRLPDDLKSLCNVDETMLRLHWGHLKFSDKCLGQFVDEVEAEFPNSLFVITGDHFARQFINTRPTLYESSCVPLILYGKQVLRGLELPKNVAGSHLDITPTLVHLAAPRGFAFASIGVDLLAPRREFLAISDSRAIGRDFIVALDGSTIVEPLPWTGADATGYRQIARDPSRAVGTFQAFHLLSSWLSQRGEQLSLREVMSARTRESEHSIATRPMSPPSVAR